MGVDVADDMIPFEIDVYVNMLKEWMEKQAQKAKKLGLDVG